MCWFKLSMEHGVKISKRDCDCPQYKDRLCITMNMCDVGMAGVTNCIDRV